MGPFADWTDVERIWRPLTPAEVITADGLISQASMKLRGWALDRGYDLDALITADVSAVSMARQEIAKYAVAAAVKRVMQNPDGTLSTSFTIDDYREDNRRDSALSTGANYIDPADLAGLLPRPRSRFGMIPMGRAL